jgi:hypothetical protein
MERDIKSKSKPKLTQCADYKKVFKKRQFKKIPPSGKEKP